MSQFANKANVLRTRFKTEVETGHADLEGRVEYDNHVLKPEPTSKQRWARVSVREGDSTQVEFGRNRYRNPGVLIVQVFVPIGEGDDVAREIADEAALAFRAQSFSGVHCKVPSIRTIGRTGSWWQVNLSVGFHWDDSE